MTQLRQRMVEDLQIRNYKLLWKPIGGLPGVSSLRIGVSAPATESQKTIQYP